MELDAVDQRVLGGLLEKERTVPTTYPLTLNALKSACNQSSGRDPILDLGDHDVLASIDRLKAAGLARIVHAGAGSRATKYRQVLDERLGLDHAERAVITLLLLRGPQTPGELRSRSDRLYDFRSLEAVDAALHALAARDEPLVEEQERRPGQKERRWTHLLGPVAASTAAPTSAPTARVAVPVVADAADGWLLVRVDAAGVNPALAAVAGALGGEAGVQVVRRTPDDALELLDDGDAVYVVGPRPFAAPKPEPSSED